MAIIQPINFTGGGMLPTNPITPMASSVPGSAPFVNSTVPQAGVRGATPGSQVTTSGQTTTNASGPNGAFSSLGPQLGTAAGNTMAAGQTALTTAMAGPGSDIYNTQFQQQQNQTNVNEAQRGITSSPYGAGVSNQADINFNQNWRNNQLNMDQAGINAATSSMAPATGLYNQSYGSTEAGYSTTPPPPAQPKDPTLNPADPSAFNSSGQSLANSTGQAASQTYNSNNNAAPPAYRSPIAPQGSAPSVPQGPMQGPAIPGQTPGTYPAQQQGPAIPGQTPGTYTDPTTGQTVNGSGQVQGPTQNGQPLAGPSIGGDSPPFALPDPSNSSPQDLVNSIPPDSSPSTIDQVTNWLGNTASSIYDYFNTPVDTSGGASGGYSDSGGDSGSW